MTAGIELVLSIDAIRFPLTGIGRYTYELARNLGTISEVSSIKYLRNNQVVDTLPEASLAKNPDPPLKLSQNKAKRFLAKSPLVVNAYRKYRSVFSPSPLDAFPNHLFHGPNFYLPKTRGPSVVTVHDLSVFTFPEFHPKERVLFLRKEIESSVKRATEIITDSEYTRAEVINYFGLDATRVHVAKLACGEEFRVRSSSETELVLQKFGITHGAYCLYAGTIEPRKNLGNLIDAYGDLSPQVRKHHPLVMAGYKGWNNQDIMEKIAKGQRAGWLRYLGYVADEDLPVLYSGARAFAFPSLYEGFGLPVLEAMASGVPVITSHQTSLPEVGGAAAAYCAPTDVGEMTQLLERALADDQYRQLAIMAGLDEVKKFSWQKCAYDTAKVYREAVATFT